MRNPLFFAVTRIFLIWVWVLVVVDSGFAQKWDDTTNMPRTLTEEERLRWHEVGMFFQPTPPPETVYRSIAEFERNEGVLVRYSDPRTGAALAWPLDLIAALSEHVMVYTLVVDDFVRNHATNAFASAGVLMENVRFFEFPTNSVWTRDYGPFYVVDEQYRISIVDFMYDRPRPSDDAIPSRLAEALEMPLYGMELIHTGGNYMGDGWGVAASTDLVWEENQNDTLLVLSAMQEYMGIRDYIVTIDPQNTYLKHIDTWAKYLDVDKIMIAEVPPSHPNYQAHEQMVDYFASKLSGWGTPYEIYRVETPFGQPYTNSLIMNERIYVPLVGSAVWDERALHAYRKAMPGYEVLGFRGNPGFNWLSTDALHCRVKEIPDRGMLSLRHVPFQGTLPFQSEMEFDVDIRAHSGYDVIADSVFLMVSINQAAFDTFLLASVDEVRYRAELALDETVETISYYFFAADESGRRAYFPLIGKEGARTFRINQQTVSTENDEIPSTVLLVENYPNPFNPTTVIRYHLPEFSQVRLEVFDITGRRMAVLVQERLGMGVHESVFDAGTLSSGLYFYHITARGDSGETHRATGKMTLIK